MEIKTGINYIRNYPLQKNGDNSSRIAFGGLNRLAQGAGAAAKKSGAIEGASNFVKKHFTKGVDVTYTDCNEILSGLRKNFGETFTGCFEEIDLYNGMVRTQKGKNALEGAKDRFIYTIDKENNSITFHKDPFLKTVAGNVLEFTEGTVLDLCVSARNLFRKAKGETAAVAGEAKSKFGKILDRRIARKEAEDSFYRLSGVFESVAGNVSKAKNEMTDKPFDRFKAIDETISDLAKNSVGKASRKVGKYNTKTERAWNRLGTGFVSACFAATDFYNISMLQNDDTKQANQSGRKRFAQDMRRQGLTAGITYIILGAMQKSVNNSIFYAALSLGGVTLISEILSRKMGGIPLKPLSSEEAAIEAEKKEKKAERKKDGKFHKTETNGSKAAPANNIQSLKSSSLNTHQGAIEQTQTPKNVFALNSFYKQNNAPENAAQNPFFTPASAGHNDEVFSPFVDKINCSNAPVQPAFGSAAQAEDTPPEKKKHKIAPKVAGFAAGAVGLSLLVGALRTRNVLGIDDAIKSFSSRYNELIGKITTKPVVMEKNEVDGFLKYLKDNNLNEQYAQLVNALGDGLELGAVKGSSNSLQKGLMKRKIDPDSMYYELGRSDARGRKALFNVLMYPVNTVKKLVVGGNNLIKTLFGQKQDKAQKAATISKDTAAELVQKYAPKYKKALEQNDLYHFRREIEDVFTRHFSEANSQNKNTSIAMISRVLITFISGYFFVNDYRNEVLIESKGKDVEGANATMRERIGHKVANFFLNSMFMDLFNTTFENIYLGSVPGATAVAMATEFTNESAVRASICTPTKKMNRDELIEYEKERLDNDGALGKYYRWFMKITGKKPLSEKASK